MDLGHWLRGLGLERYEAAFRENEIDEAVLPNLTAEDLKDLGVTIVGHRRRLLDAIVALRIDTGVQAPSTDLAIAPTATSATPRRPCGTPPGDGDVLRLGRLNSAVGAHGP